MENESKKHETGHFRLPEKFMRICCEMSPSCVTGHYTYGDHAFHGVASYLTKRLRFNIQYVGRDENGDAVFFYSDVAK